MVDLCHSQHCPLAHTGPRRPSITTPRIIRQPHLRIDTDPANREIDPDLRGDARDRAALAEVDAHTPGIVLTAEEVTITDAAIEPNVIEATEIEKETDDHAVR